MRLVLFFSLMIISSVSYSAVGSVTNDFFKHYITKSSLIALYYRNASEKSVYYVLSSLKRRGFNVSVYNDLPLSTIPDYIIDLKIQGDVYKQEDKEEIYSEMPTGPVTTNCNKIDDFVNCRSYQRTHKEVSGYKDVDYNIYSVVVGLNWISTKSRKVELTNILVISDDKCSVGKLLDFGLQNVGDFVDLKSSYSDRDLNSNFFKKIDC